MGTKRTKVANWSIQKAMKWDPKVLYEKARKGQPRKHKNEKYIKDDKLDGLRGFAIVRLIGKKWEATAYTSNGCLVPNAKLICRDIEQALAGASQKELGTKYHGAYHGFVLDGEFEVNNWNTTNSAVMTQTYSAKLAAHLTLNTFDILPITDWDAKKCDIPLYKRKEALQSVVDAIDSVRVVALAYKVYDKLTEEIIAKELARALRKGKEGVMFKLYNGLYRWKRSKDWLKVKPVKSSTEDLKIIGAELGTKGKRNGERLGHLLLEGKVNGKKIKTHCGGGFSDKQREELWAMHKKGKLVGLTAEVLFDNITINSAVRFPRFFRLRKDKVL